MGLIAVGEPGFIDGLVLCLAGDFRFAFAANDVEGVDAWHDAVTSDTPCVREMFNLPRLPGRIVRHEGESLVVDALEVASESTKLFPVPSLFVKELGGALEGFVLHQKRLQPLVRFVPFAAFVQKGRVSA